VLFRSENRFSVTPELFRTHLEKLYQAGFVTAKLEDIMSKPEMVNNKKIVVLRFDDSRADQFRYVKDSNDALIVDPNCAVGILLDFYKAHPDFGKHAVFCVIALESFHQPRFIKEKHEFLLDHGLEIANHTYDHERLGHARADDVDREFGTAMVLWEKWLGPRAEEIKLIAPPFGAVPDSQAARERLQKFEWQGKQYKPLGILLAGRKYNYVCPYPTSKEFNRYALPSLEVTSKNFDEILREIS
jgi:hypothetical protein